MASNKKLLQKFRVPLGFLFGITFMIFSRPTPRLMLIGGLIAITGLAIRAWSAGHIRKNRELAISGPYRYTRNPLYFGSFLLGLGFSIASGVWWIVLLFVILYLGIYLPVMSVEAEELTDLFGDDFQSYADKVALFIPWRSMIEPSEKRFELELYLRYREYQAFLGSIFAWTVLGLKAYFFN